MRRMISVGLGNLISVDEVLAIIVSGSSPAKRLKDEGELRGQLIDATQGRKTRALVVTRTGHVVLSAVAPDTIGQRLEESSSDRASQTESARDLQPAGEPQAE